VCVCVCVCVCIGLTLTLAHQIRGRVRDGPDLLGDASAADSRGAWRRARQDGGRAGRHRRRRAGRYNILKNTTKSSYVCVCVYRTRRQMSFPRRVCTPALYSIHVSVSPLYA